LAEVPRSTFYASQDRPESRRVRRDRYLLMYIQEAYVKSRRT